MTVPLVDVRRAGAVTTLALQSLHNRNALSSALLDELADGLRDATTDEGVRAVVLTATGTTFCSGADLSERAGVSTARLAEVLLAITTARVPVIARVNGHARAGGLGLIAASDMAVGLASGTFAFSEVRVGVAPAIILVPALPRMDRRFLTRATLTGEPFTGAAAAQAGLLTGVVEDEAALDDWVAAALASILAAAPGAVGATKALLADPEFAARLTAAAARSAELFAGGEAAEGIDAFLHKRPPSWVVTP